MVLQNKEIISGQKLEMEQLKRQEKRMTLEHEMKVEEEIGRCRGRVEGVRGEVRGLRGVVEREGNVRKVEIGSVREEILEAAKACAKH